VFKTLLLAMNFVTSPVSDDTNCITAHSFKNESLPMVFINRPCDNYSLNPIQWRPDVYVNSYTR